MLNLGFLFPPTPPFFMTALSVVSLVSYARIGIAESKGKHLQYSKFATDANKTRVSSRNGMLLLYAPAFLAGAASFALFPDADLRFLLLKSALTLHFFKRVFEVLFIHKYSGEMTIDDSIVISFGYFSSTAIMIYFQHLLQGLPEPLIDSKYFGVALFLIGIVGNFYHHYLLSSLRTNGDAKEYKIPKGGLFDFVICPHYLFEILGFWGFAFISQTLYALCFALGTTFYLTGRSYATKKWYISKFEDFPKNFKLLIPGVF